MNKISVSVIVTCHNLEKYLDDCINSLAHQTKQPTEIIIVHDNCEHPPQFYAGTISLFRHIQRGVARTRHEGVLLSTSANILFLDADDVLEEVFIERMLDARVANPDAVLYPNVLLWASWGKPENWQRNKWHESPDTVDGEALYAINPCVVTSLMTKELYIKLGGFDGKLILFEDWDFWWKAFDQGTQFVKVPGAVLKYRQRQESRNHLSTDDVRSEMYQLIRERHGKNKE